MRADELDRSVREELRSFAKPIAETVARHLVATGRLMAEDPPLALSHAVAARRLASRVAVVREAVGVAAYHAGEWQTAISELRTYHRMSGRLTHLAVLADCERALGRPEKAIDIYRSTPRGQLTREEAVELLIVAAGARSDLGQPEAAAAMLQVPELTNEVPEAARLRYAYAEALLSSGDQQQAREWFARALDADEDGMTGAAERLLELDGVLVDEVDEAAETTPLHRDEPTILPAAPPASTGDEPAEPAAPQSTGVADPPASGERDAAALDARPEMLADAYDLLVIDLDGVVYRGAEVIPPAAEVISQLRENDRRLVFATNNASRSGDDIADQLAALGIPVRPDEVLTSAAATADHLATLLPAQAPVLVVGAPALSDELRRVGLLPVPDAGGAPEAVVQGYGPLVGWTDLAEACVAIRAGAMWVATNTDATLPTERGPLPGNGALVAALRTALGRAPDLVIGKPQPALFLAATQRAGAKRPLVVGDRLDTDIDGARLAGMDSLLVLTGVDDEAAVAARPAGQRPTFVGADLSALLEPPPRRTM